MESIAGQLGSAVAHIQAEEALSRSEFLYRSLVAKMSSAVIFFAFSSELEDYIVQSINEAASQAENIREDEAEGKCLSQIRSVITEIGLARYLERAAREGGAVRIPLSHFIDKKGEKWREGWVYLLPSGELVLVYDDVTEKMGLAKQQEV